VFRLRSFVICTRDRLEPRDRPMRRTCVDDEQQRLKQDLLVTEQFPPLTLEAAIAIDSAERADCPREN